MKMWRERYHWCHVKEIKCLDSSQYHMHLSSRVVYLLTNLAPVSTVRQETLETQLEGILQKGIRIHHLRISQDQYQLTQMLKWYRHISKSTKRMKHWLAIIKKFWDHLSRIKAFYKVDQQPILVIRRTINKMTQNTALLHLYTSQPCRLCQRCNHAKRIYRKAIRIATCHIIQISINRLTSIHDQISMTKFTTLNVQTPVMVFLWRHQRSVSTGSILHWRMHWERKILCTS